MRSKPGSKCSDDSVPVPWFVYLKKPVCLFACVLQSTIPSAPNLSRCPKTQPELTSSGNVGLPLVCLFVCVHSELQSSTLTVTFGSRCGSLDRTSQRSQESQWGQAKLPLWLYPFCVFLGFAVILPALVCYELMKKMADKEPLHVVWPGSIPSFCRSHSHQCCFPWLNFPPSNHYPIQCSKGLGEIFLKYNWHIIE